MTEIAFAILGLVVGVLLLAGAYLCYRLVDEIQQANKAMANLASLIGAAMNERELKELKEGLMRLSSMAVPAVRQMGELSKAVNAFYSVAVANVGAGRREADAREEGPMEGRVYHRDEQADAVTRLAKQMDEDGRLTGIGENESVADFLRRQG